jgi:hypothetical protein
MELSLAEAETKLRDILEAVLVDHVPAFWAEADQWCAWVNSRTATSGTRYAPCFPSVPFAHGIRVTPGVGKSEQVRRLLPRLLERIGGPIYFFVPTHELAEEQAEKFNALAPPFSADVYRGIARPDPCNTTIKMCRRADEVTLLLNNGLTLSSICADEQGKCPHHPDASLNPCAYRSQATKGIDVWFLPSQYAFMGLSDSFESPKLVIFDEAFWQNGLTGFDKYNPNRLAISTLPNDFISRKLFRALTRMT